MSHGLFSSPFYPEFCARIIMFSKDHSLSASPGTVLSVLCLLLYSAGFVRFEMKFTDHDRRLQAVEEAIVQLKHAIAEISLKGTVPIRLGVALM